MDKPKSRSESLSIAFWAIKLIYKLTPGLLVGKIATGSLLELNPIVSNVITGLTINFFVSTLTTQSFNTTELAGIIGIYILHGVIYTSAIRLINQFCSSNIRRTLRFAPRMMTAEKLNYLGIEFLEDPKSNNLITRSRENFNRIETVIEISSVLIGLVITLITSGIILLSFSPILAIAILIINIPRFIFNRRFIQKEYNLERETTIENRISDGNMGYLITSSALKEVLSLNAYNFLIKSFKSFSNKLISTTRKNRSEHALGIFLLRMLEIPIFIYLFLLLIEKMISNAISIGYANIITNNVWMFSGTIGGVVGTYTDLTESTIRLKEVKELLESERTREDGTIELLDKKNPPLIEFKNIDFKYPDSKKLIYKNFNLTINSGEKIAIVGHNGAGKTTLVKLLTKIYPVNQGVVSIDKYNIKDITDSSLNKHIGILFQDYNTYEHLSVRDNIAIGNIQKAVDDREIWKALEMADAKEFVEEYPLGLDTILSEKYEGGIRPSTGQSQKIAIARFFYRDAPILILDEPTASIDAVAEAHIFDRIYSFIQNKTVIIISHRFSTVRNADRIIVIEKGKIIEEGDHKTLLSQNGAYAHAFNLQAKGYGD